MAPETRPLHSEPESMKPRPWPLSLRVAFRFSFLYFGIFCLLTQTLPILLPRGVLAVPDLSIYPPVRSIVFWTAAHVFRIATPLVYQGSGSGDKTFDWVLVFCGLAFAVIGTALWTIADRKRANYTALYKWFHVFLRFALGSELLLYGMDKVIPLQMPFPSLTRLVEPYGNFSPMGVLWYSVGASTSYEIFVGAAEAVGGILLFIPRTAMLGALICLMDVVEVFTLNMTYDVPVKLFAFHLIVMALVILGPEIRRIATFLFTDRNPGAAKRPVLFASSRANRNAAIAQAAYGFLLLASNVYGGWTAWHAYGGGAPKSPLYGIWNVESLKVDGQRRPLLATGPDQWRRVIFDRPTVVSIQRMDDKFVQYSASIDAKSGRIVLTKPTNQSWRFQRNGPQQMTLDGALDGHPAQMELSLQDRSKFLLVNRGFHWVQEYPFNR